MYTSLLAGSGIKEWERGKGRGKGWKEGIYRDKQRINRHNR